MRFLRHDLRLLRGLRCVMNHRVGVFDADAVSAGLLLEQSHQRIVVILLCPITLPFEQRRDGREPNCARLHRARQSRFLRGGRSRSATILNDVDVVARAEQFVQSDERWALDVPMRLLGLCLSVYSVGQSCVQELDLTRTASVRSFLVLNMLVSGWMLFCLPLRQT